MEDCARKARMLRSPDRAKAWTESALAEMASSDGPDTAPVAGGAFCVGYLLPAKPGSATGLATLCLLPLRCASANGMAQRERSRNRYTPRRRRALIDDPMCAFTLFVC